MVTHKLALLLFALHSLCLPQLSIQFSLGHQVLHWRNSRYHLDLGGSG